jgi:ribonucleoside-diphosphate reductase alpha chain
MDYLFRRLALIYLSDEERNELGIFSTDERMQPPLPGVEASMIQNRNGLDVQPTRHPDAPLCMQCGDRMMRAGT